MKKYSLVYNSWNQKEKIALNKVIKSNNFTMGKKVIETLDKLFKTWKPREKYELVNANETQDKVVPHKLVY